MNKQTEKATQAVKEKGKDLTDLILKILEKQEDGANIYELYVMFKHDVKSPGTIKSALERLEEDNLIENKEFRQNGRKVIQYFVRKKAVSDGYVEVNSDKINEKL